MEQRTLKTLEYDKIISQLVLRASCCVSREICEKLTPCESFEAMREALDITSQAETIYIKSGYSPVDDFPDVRPSLKRIKATLTLSIPELLAIAKAMRAVRECRASLVNGDTGKDLLAMAHRLITNDYAEDEINRCILNEDELSDSASPALARIRNQMRLANERVKEKLNSYIHSQSYQKFLQEPIVTLRNGRYVLPVKAECRGSIQGLIHDQSSSGQTLFIEPAAVVELGNEVKKLRAEELAEIERILTELTALIAPCAGDLYSSLLMLGEIDFAFAKARLAREMHAIEPKISNDGQIRIVKGRHPLIPADRVVPLDIWLGDDFNTLIITGPNTGGKTVTLKTVGLFTLLAMSGLFVPAGEGTRLSYFENVFADIGDEQSIEQNLSTFSSHMKNIVHILDEATYNPKQSLILLDELGAGTDPTEGAALAMAILEKLHDDGCTTVATTHYSEIKAFALSRQGMENASMEFDVNTLSPTYRLFVGIPGKSNAFEISKKLGIKEEIITKAKTFLEEEDVKLEDIITSADASRKIAEKERELAVQAQEELYRLRAQAEEERKRFEENKEKYKRQAKDEAKRIVAQAKAEAEAVIRELRELKSSNQSETERKIQESRDKLRKSDEALAPEKAVQAEQKQSGEVPKSVIPGQTVYVVSLDKEATVLEALGKAEASVQVGIMKMKVKLSDLRTVNKQNKTENTASVTKPKRKSVKLELDIRGLMVDEAIPVVDSYLDDAYLAGLNEVSIIHGKGTGALRAGVQNYLKHHKHVSAFRMGSYGQGDAGVTVVTIKHN